MFARLSFCRFTRIVMQSQTLPIRAMSNSSYKNCAPKPKRLIVCFDGTCESSVTGRRNIPSNVTRLARAIAKAGVDDKEKEWQQVVYYDSGVATGSMDMISEAAQAGTGEGLLTNIIEGYNFLVNNYYPGDQVFCFGFSRGAFTARCVAGLVADIGIFKPDNFQDFPPLWAAYQKNIQKHEFRKTIEYYQYVHGRQPMVPADQADVPYVLQAYDIPHDVNESIWPDSHHIEVLGCWDTVGSLGLADIRLFNNAWSRRQFQFLNLKLSPYIKHAFHALALDEHREPFTPTLFYVPNPETLKAEEEELKKDEKSWPELTEWRRTIEAELAVQRGKHRPDLYQVWFPGVHINVGGGSDKDSYDGEGLSNITFAWMVQMLGPYLAFEPWTWGKKGMGGFPRRVVEEQQRYKSNPQQSTASHLVSGATSWITHKLGFAHDPKLVKPTQIKDLSLTSRADGKKFHWAVSEFQDSYNRMYAAMNDPKDRMPGECVDRSTDKGTKLRELGTTNEYIHPSAEWRRKELAKEKDPAKHYNSKALKDFQRTTDNTGATAYYKKSGDHDVWIPEWYIKPADKGAPESDAWKTAEWGLTIYVEDSVKVHEFLNEIHDLNVAREKKKEAAKI